MLTPVADPTVREGRYGAGVACNEDTPGCCRGCQDFLVAGSSQVPPLCDMNDIDSCSYQCIGERMSEMDIERNRRHH